MSSSEPMQLATPSRRPNRCRTSATTDSTPVGSLTFRGRKIVYSKDGQAGKLSTELYNRLRAIQLGDVPDKYNWVYRIPPPKT